MPIGKPLAAARGFTYLGLLLLLALLAAALAGLGPRVSTAAQREREAELLFRGRQIGLALQRYRAAAQPAQWPARLDDLLSDHRLDPPAHHLRRLYPDPFTGRPDWTLVLEEGSGRVRGVRSRSHAKRLNQVASRTALAAETGEVSDWLFLADTSPGAPPEPAARGEGDTTPQHPGGPP